MKRPRRALVALTLAASLVAACGDSDAGPEFGRPIERTTAPPGTGAAQPPPMSPRSTAARGASPTSVAATVPRGGALEVEEPVGQYAPALLRPSPAPRVVLELIAQRGAEPRAETVDHLVQTFREPSGKTMSVSRISIPGGSRTWTAADVKETARANAQARHGNGQAVVRCLYLAGSFEQPNVLGVALQGDLFAVFTEDVRRAASPLSGAAPIERAVSAHELGHLLGLVDLYLATGRADPQHPGHSKNRGSVMYWAVESGLVAEILSGPPPDSFDEDDLKDLRAIRDGR